MSTSVRRTSAATRVGSLWYLAVPVLSLGLLTFLPFVHAAVRLRRAALWLAAAGFALVAAAVITVSGQSDDAVPSAVDGVVVVAALASMVGGAAVLARLRRDVYGVAGPPSTEPAVDPAVRQVLEARARRARARELAAADPLMARELGIGRPDLGGDYDDGGLVDIATAPASAIAEVCALTPEQAAEIVAARDAVLTVEDLFSLIDLPLSAWDRVRDRAVLIR